MLLDETLSTRGGSTEAGGASGVVMVVCALVMHPSDVHAVMAKLKKEEQETKKNHARPQITSIFRGQKRQTCMLKMAGDLHPCSSRRLGRN